MLGREHEQRAVEAVIASALEGRAASLLLVGLPGIGKTTLLDHAEQHATAVGMAAYRITAVEAESGIPGSGLSLLRPLLGDGNLSDPWTLLRSLTDLAAEHPLLLVLDDVHWLDEASTAALRFVARRLADDAVALLLAARPEIDHPPRLQEIERLAVDALPRPDAVALLRSVSPTTPPDVAEALAASLGDVPLALVEAPALLTSDMLDGSTPLPTTIPVGRSISARYARGVDALPRPARRALVIASAEDSGDPTVLAQALVLADLSSHDLEPAVDAGLLLPGAELRFRHPLVRAAVHSSATEAERRAAHRLLAGVHAAVGDSELRLRHAAAATVGPDEELAAELEAAVAEVAVRRGIGGAAVIAGQAAALSPRPEDRWRRLVQSIELDRFRASSATMARDVVERCSDPELRARAAIVLAEEHLVGEEQADVLRGALAWMGRGPAARELVEVYAELLRARLDFDGVHQAAQLLSDWEAEGSLGLDALMPGLLWLFLGRTSHGSDLIRQGVAASEFLDPEEIPLPYLTLWVNSAAALDEVAWNEDPLAHRKRSACALLRRTREPRWAATADLLDATEALHCGQLTKAAGILRNVLALVPALGWFEADILGLLVVVESHRGDDGATHRELESFLAACAGIDDRYHALRAHHCRALLLVRSGRAADALTELENVEVLRETWPRGVSLPCLALRVEALAALGRMAEAQQAASELERRATGHGSLRLRAWVELAHALAQTDDARARFDTAVALARQGQSLWELARALLLQGEWLRRARRPAEARKPLGEAARLFRQTGAVPWALRAEQELAAAGEVAAAPARNAAVDLTPQELRIALAVAEGQSNNDIAGTVFLSVKTVETHLTRIYRKLGVRSRGGVAKALADAGIAA